MSGDGSNGGHGLGILAPIVQVATLVILAANLLALSIGVAPNLSTRIVDFGERLWPGYGSELRVDPTPPDCDAAELGKRLEACRAATPTAAPAPPSDPFATPAPAPDPFAAPAAPAPDPFATPAPAPAADPFATPGPAPAGGDPFAAPAPAGGDPFAPAPAAGVSCEALAALQAQCEQSHAAYASTMERITPEVKRFRAVELFVSDIARFEYWKHTLVLVVVLGAASATASRMHVAMRQAKSPTEHKAVQLAQLASHLLLLFSCLADWQVERTSASSEGGDAVIPLMWVGGFALLSAINVWHLVRPPPELTGGTNPGRVLMCIPLYAYLVILSGTYFLLVEQHWSGQAIYLHKFIGYPSIYIGIALYVWAGMMLSETRIAPLVFDVLAPWKLSPQILGWLVAVISAVPTAYSGASGIFVIATGKVVFQRLRLGGASVREALGATAMSGSLGVVLRPCLIVVLIAVLNKQVTTDALFESGLHVFLLTSSIYLLFMLWLKKRSTETVDVNAAAGASLRSLLALVPFAALAVGTVLFYEFAFDIHLNEHTAQLVLPTVLLLAVAYDRVMRALGGPEAHADAAPAHAAPVEPRQGVVGGLWGSLSRASHETSHHAGALLMVMAGSVGFGGIVERSDVMELVPHELGSPYLAMAILTVAMILVGMAMDALGAVVLVSVTIAPIAYENGIDPIHFWMMALVAFELGYLHPPVGLNILLARQVVGRDAETERVPVEGFFRKYEHFIVPCTVMAISLGIVAFVPFAFYGG